MSVFEKVNTDKIDPNTKNLVHGYARNIQKSMDQIIPEAMIFIILSFYYLSEYFKEFEPDLYEHTINNRTIKSIKHDSTNGTVYGAVSVSLSDHIQKCIWKFKIITNRMNYIYIGICSTYQTKGIFYYSRGKESNAYCLQLDGYKWTDSDPDEYTVQPFNEGDIISMELNLDLKHLIYAKNGNGLGIAYNNINLDDNVTYKMAVIMRDKGDEIELTDFECVYKSK